MKTRRYACPAQRGFPLRPAPELVAQRSFPAALAESFRPARGLSLASRGCALTVHKTQGVTVDRAHMVAEEMSGREWSYVAASRMRIASAKVSVYMLTAPVMAERGKRSGPRGGVTGHRARTREEFKMKSMLGIASLFVALASTAVVPGTANAATIYACQTPGGTSRS